MDIWAMRPNTKYDFAKTNGIMEPVMEKRTEISTNKFEHFDFAP